MASRVPDTINAAGTRIEEQTGASVLTVAADLRSGPAIEYWRDATVERFGGVDLLFTNSGGPPPGGFSSFDDPAWQDAFELLVLSVIRMAPMGKCTYCGEGAGIFKDFHLECKQKI